MNAPVVRMLRKRGQTLDCPPAGRIPEKRRPVMAKHNRRSGVTVKGQDVVRLVVQRQATYLLVFLAIPEMNPVSTAPGQERIIRRPVIVKSLVFLPIHLSKAFAG